jgi:hypothetical protein
MLFNKYNILYYLQCIYGTNKSILANLAKAVHKMVFHCSFLSDILSFSLIGEQISQQAIAQLIGGTYNVTFLSEKTQIKV